MKKLILIFLVFVSANCFSQQQQFWALNTTSTCPPFGIATMPDALYSFRKIVPCYTGPCVSIRRSSDNATSNFGFTGDFVDTASIKSFIGASDAYVLYWYDQSNHNDTMIQATTASQPQIAQGGALLYADGKLAIRFDGSNDYLLAAQMIGIAPPWSFFGVSKRNGVAADFVAVAMLGYSASTTFAGIQNFTSTSSRLAVNETPFKSATAGAATTNLSMASGFISGGNLLASDGTTTGVGTYTSALTGLDRFSIGAIVRGSNVYGSGFVSEVIAYATDQTSNRVTIESNIKTYYGL